VWVERLKKASVTFGYLIRCPAEERVVLSAEVELACARLSKDGLKVCALPQDLAQALGGE
ncbi:MAG: hypothetical protein MK291_06350, partial [Planctomycetes bacterium]|nr:hypothetical protein [Planctomycetota bacterium]